MKITNVKVESIGGINTVFRGSIEVSSPGEFHPKALAELGVSVSTHPAPIIQPYQVGQDANAQRATAGSELPARANAWRV